MFTYQDHEKIVEGPKKMVNLPPRSYCIIKNPIVIDEDGNPVINNHGEVKVRFGHLEVRVQENLGLSQFKTYSEPFPLYPYEQIEENVKKCTTLKDNEALKLKCIRPFKDDRSDGAQRFPEDTWLIKGPQTYYPFVDEVIVEKVNAVVITHEVVVVLEANRDTIDEEGKPRIAGAKWLHTKLGAFIPSVDVSIVDYRSPKVITEKKCIQLRALKNATDVYGNKRKAGDEWLITLDISSTHIVSPQEEFVGDVNITVLSSQEYCFVVNPMNKDGTHRYGERQLRKGEDQFFLQPGESLENGWFIKIHTLEENDCLLLKAKSPIKDGDIERKAGETWMIRGPCNFIPTIDIQILEKRFALPLGDNEGVYVRSK